MDKLRITFKKGEQVKYISHLDLMRTFIRTVRRANIPVKYSEGFNPHAKLNFALPLAVGVTSDCEVLDITLEQSVEIMNAVSALNKTLPNGLEIIKAYITQDKMPDFNRASYIVTIENESDTDKLKHKIIQAMRSGDIIVEKKTKKKTTMVNIIEHIYNFEITKAEGKIIILNMTLSAGNKFTLKPELVLDGIKNLVADFKPVDLNIHRTEILV